MKSTQTNVRPDNLVFPSELFENYYVKFKTVKEITEDDEFKKTYSNFYTFTPFELDIPVGETTNDQNNFTTEQQLQELIKCAKDFNYWRQGNAGSGIG